MSDAARITQIPRRGRNALPSEAVRFLQLARIRDATADLRAAGHALITVNDIAAAAGVSRRTVYDMFAGADEAIADAISAAQAYVVPQIVVAFDRQATAPVALRAAIERAVAVLSTRDAWSRFWLQWSPSSRPGSDVRDGLGPLVSRLTAIGGEHAAIAAVDAVVGALREHLAGDGKARPPVEGITAVVLAVLGLPRRVPAASRVVNEEAPLAELVVQALSSRSGEPLPGADALIESAVKRRDGVALWRAFVTLQRLDAPSTRHGDLTRLMNAVLEGLGTALPFGVPARAIVDGTASEVWLPADDGATVVRYLRANPGAHASEILAATDIPDSAQLNRLLWRLWREDRVRFRRAGQLKRWWA